MQDEGGGMSILLFAAVLILVLSNWKVIFFTLLGLILAVTVTIAYYHIVRAIRERGRDIES